MIPPTYIECVDALTALSDEQIANLAALCAKSLRNRRAYSDLGYAMQCCAAECAEALLQELQATSEERQA